MSIKMLTGAARENLINDYKVARARVDEVSQQLDGYDGGRHDQDERSGGVLVKNVKLDHLRSEIYEGRKESFGATEVVKAKFGHKAEGSILTSGALFSKVDSPQWKSETWDSQQSPDRVVIDYHGSDDDFTFIENRLSGILTFLGPEETSRAYL